ncbi:MAG: penicillin-binding protein 1C [Bacteroidetes bacterium]|nr:MAG: penicillin-binding protein 1C [Bacteroidota bacterium]
MLSLFSRLRPWAWRHRRKLIPAGILLLLYVFCLPDPLFKDPLSTVLEDRKGQLLGARIAADGQWRFPEREDAPEKFAVSLITFEDKRFYYHPGVDPLAMFRAVGQNLRGRSVISGGSTLSMQVIRLSRKGKSRTLWEKLIEIVLATRLELRYSKQEILGLYASHAPFGGNVVGIDAASWKYFGRDAASLSWAESALLAVLPNAPGLIHPGKNRDQLLGKRNRLLTRLRDTGVIDAQECELALLESLPSEPIPLPSLAPHLLERVHKEFAQRKGAVSRIRSTVDGSLQQRAREVMARHAQSLAEGGVHNAAALIVEVETGDVLAYLGNAECSEREYGCDVDIIQAPRSSGSILKPFLYASMLHSGELLPDMLVPDIPSYYPGFTPANFDHTYAGALPAHRALARSLNVPAVRMLQQHGVNRFRDELIRLGMTTLFRSSDEYGLTLVLGGAESSLQDLAAMYGGMARTLRYFSEYDGAYNPAAFRPLNLMLEQSRGPLTDMRKRFSLSKDSPLGAASVWFTFDAMERVTRPDVESYWERFSSSGRIAWKTGTSFGFRDAWAIGVTPRYVIAVWVGNADGEGRPSLIGGTAAAPLLFDLYQLTGPDRSWFLQPYDDMEQFAVCRQSGHPTGPYCPDSDTLFLPRSSSKPPVCPYHQLVHLDAGGKYQVNSSCASPSDMIHEAFFVLPPAQEAYFRSHHPDYRVMPPMREGCTDFGAQGRNMDILYPKPETDIYLPVNLDGSMSHTVFEAAHRSSGATIYWHLDEQYIGKTVEIHKMSLQPTAGQHTLTLVDDRGETLLRSFRILPGEGRK